MWVPSLPELKPTEVNPMILIFDVKFPLFLPNVAHTHTENEKPPWNAKTAVPSHDFDEWFHMQHRPPRTTDEDLRDYHGSEWRGFKVFGKFFLIPQSLIVALFQKTRDQKMLFLFYFLASSWGRNGEIVSCAVTINTNL